MTYADQAALLSSSSWRSRVDACTREQAGIYASDARPEYKELAAAVIHEPMGSATYAVAAQVTSAPGMSEEVTDQAILSAVQMVWPKVGITFVTP